MRTHAPLCSPIIRIIAFAGLKRQSPATNAAIEIGTHSFQYGNRLGKKERFRAEIELSYSSVLFTPSRPPLHFRMSPFLRGSLLLP